MRKQPPNNVPQLTRKAAPDRIVMERQYRLLTPLYGGGPTAGEVDRATPIHGTGIRGQLRFWWRATQAGRFATVAEMKTAEDKLWGSTDHVSAVTVHVVESSIGQELPVRNNRGETANVGDPDTVYGYVAFPLREAAGKVYQDGRFKLQVSLPADEGLAEEVRAAFWAWDTFGGVGARTRRGFGALTCENVHALPGSADFNLSLWHWEYDVRRVMVKLMADVRTLVQSGAGPDDVPKLSRLADHFKTTPPQASDLGAWTELIAALKQFRQASQQQYGRSSWPEPDAIRKITGQETALHATPIHGRLIRKFPRARFGLPIIFEFRHGADHAGQTGRDPRKTTLTLAGHNRLASPLIIRPLACSGRQFVGLALILAGNRIPDGRLQLQEMNGAPIEDVDADMNATEAGLVNAKHDATITPDILQSFLDSLSL